MTSPSIVNPLQLSEGEVRFYKEEGYLLLPNLLAVPVVEALHAEVLHIMERSNVAITRLQKSEGASDKLIQTNQFLRGSQLENLIYSEALKSLAGKLMGGDASMYLPFTAVKSGGAGRFHFHQDNQYTRFDGPGINIWFALSTMSPASGCLQVVPRSHLAGTIDSVESSDGDGHRTVAHDPTRFVPIRMRAGDAIAFTRLTLHGSGANNTSQPRVAYAIQFHRNDVKATWDNQTSLLVERPRWPQIKPLDKIVPPEQKTYDGH